METRPKVVFPQQCDQVYYPGRQAVPWAAYPAGLFAAVVGADRAVSPPAGPARLCEMVVGVVMFALGVGVVVRTWTLRRRTAIGLTAKGLYYRDWLNRVWHLPWGAVEQVAITEAFRRGTDRITGGPSYFGTQREAICLTGRFVPGGRTMVRATIRSRALLEESDVEVNPMVSAIVTRAGLVPGPARAHERTWVRGR